jgi:hypothetical protein
MFCNICESHVTATLPDGPDPDRGQAGRVSLAVSAFHAVCP